MVSTFKKYGPSVALVGGLVLAVVTCGCMGGDDSHYDEPVHTLDDLGIKINGKISDTELNALAKSNRLNS